MKSELKNELMDVNETIREADASFNRLSKDYYVLWKHTDKLEAILRKHNIPFPAFQGCDRKYFYNI